MDVGIRFIKEGKAAFSLNRMYCLQVYCWAIDWITECQIKFCCYNNQTNWPIKGWSWSVIQSVVQNMTVLNVPKLISSEDYWIGAIGSQNVEKGPTEAFGFFPECGMTQKQNNLYICFLLLFSNYGIWHLGGTLKEEWIFWVKLNTNREKPTVKGLYFLQSHFKRLHLFINIRALRGNIKK